MPEPPTPASLPSATVGGSITDLDITTEQTSRTSARSMSPLTDAVRDASGAAGLGYLVGLVDVNTAMVGLCASSPDWTATSDLMLHEAAPLVHGPTILESHLTRAGSRLIVVGVDIYDGDGLTDMDELTDPLELTRVATGLVTFAASRIDVNRLGDVGPDLDDRRASPHGTQRRPPDRAVARADRPHGGRCAGRSRRGGELALRAEQSRSYQRRRARHGVPGRGRGSSTGVRGQRSAHPLPRRERVGPIRTDTHVVREVDDHVVCRVVAMDAGADDLVVAQATVTLQRH